MINDNLFVKFRLAILAGIAISIGCVVYLKVGSVAGAVLFAFGLLTCVHFKLPLYTGTAGFVMNKKEVADLFVILVGNILGCLLMALAMRYSNVDVPDKAAMLTAKRMELSAMQSVVLGVFCGFIMTVAVKFAREKSYLPLLFGVPVFILCGFLHSIADAFYIQVSPTGLLKDNWLPILVNYIGVVAGNFVGCNLYRIIRWRVQYSE